MPSDETKHLPEFPGLAELPHDAAATAKTHDTSHPPALADEPTAATMKLARALIESFAHAPRGALVPPPSPGPSGGSSSVASPGTSAETPTTGAGTSWPDRSVGGLPTTFTTRTATAIAERVRGLPPESICALLRASGDDVPTERYRELTNYGGSWRHVTAMTYYRPTDIAHLIHAVREAESRGSSVHAIGSAWSYSDVAWPETEPRTDGAFETIVSGGVDVTTVVDTTRLDRSLQGTLPGLLREDAPGLYFHVEAGITLRELNLLLDLQAPRVALATLGGANGQTLAGAIATGTHGGDFDRPPLADWVRAIHMISAGGIEHWIEPARGITDPSAVRRYFPCIRAEHIHYDDDLFRAAIVGLGGLGIIYSVILEVVPQYGLAERRVWTDWQSLVPAVGTDLRGVLDGTRTGLGGPDSATRNRFAEIVVNPYINAAGHNECVVTNRVERPEPLERRNRPSAPPTALDPEILAASIEPRIPHGDLHALARLGGLVSAAEREGWSIERRAVELLELAMEHDYRWLTAAAIRGVMLRALPAGDRSGVGYELMEVASLGSLPTLSVEAAVPLTAGVDLVDRILRLVGAFAAREHPARRIHVGGYISLRVCGRTQALLGMQRFDPTAMIEVAVLSGTRGAAEFIDAVQRTALDAGAALHWGQCNSAATRNHMQFYGHDALTRWSRARGTLLRPGGDGLRPGGDRLREPYLATFDNALLRRLGLTSTG